MAEKIGSISINNEAIPTVESFEFKHSLSNFHYSKNSTVSLSNKHHKFGQQSLQWQWRGNSKISTQNFSLLTHAQSPLPYGKHFPASPILIISLYSEHKQNTVLRLSYSKQQQELVWFELPINFSGWRTVAVPFYEMNGTPPNINEAVNYDTFTVKLRAIMPVKYILMTLSIRNTKMIAIRIQVNKCLLFKKKHNYRVTIYGCHYLDTWITLRIFCLIN
ncbi:chondroitinase family protein [Pseudocolwellia sp. HL-MZ19]|uniref:chondroitinase family protein n=1 Tax=Pseudocolwellia sp. HL-MZ19 TaxID=3400846 RepID=UPI003CEDBCF6